MLAACQSTIAPPATNIPINTLAPTAIPVTSTSTPAPTLQPTSTPETITRKISPTDGMTQLFVPAGTVYMGGLDVLLDSDEIPAHKVQLNAFWIDQVEVTNGMYGLCVEAGTCRLPLTINSVKRFD